MFSSNSPDHHAPKACWESSRGLFSLCWLAGCLPLFLYRLMSQSHGSLTHAGWRAWWEAAGEEAVPQVCACPPGGARGGARFLHRVLQDWRRCCELLLLSCVIYLCFLHHCGALSAQWALNDVKWFILWSFFVISQLLIIICCLFVMFLVLLCLCGIWLSNAASVCFHFVLHYFLCVCRYFKPLCGDFDAVFGCLFVCVCGYFVSVCTHWSWHSDSVRVSNPAASVRGWGETKTVVSQKEETLQCKRLLQC